MKKCPYCAEEIQDEAKVCRYCGRELTNLINPQQMPAPSKPVQQAAQPPARKPFNLRRWIIIAAAAVVTFCVCIGVIASFGNSKTPSSAATPPKQGATVVINVATSTAGPIPTTAPTIAPTEELGKTRDKPLPRNSVVDIGGDMQVMITNVQRPANDIVAQGNMFNDTPVPNAQEYMMALKRNQGAK